MTLNDSTATKDATRISDNQNQSGLANCASQCWTDMQARESSRLDTKTAQDFGRIEMVGDNGKVCAN